MSVSFASQFHKDKEDWLGWMTSLIMVCVLGKESEHKQAYLILQRENYFYYTRQQACFPFAPVEDQVSSKAAHYTNSLEKISRTKWQPMSIARYTEL